MNKDDSRLRHVRQTCLKITELSVTRLAVHRTNLHIHAQVFSEDGTKVLASASTAEAEVRKELNGSGSNTAAAILAGKRITEEAKVAGIEAVVFDRPGFCHHGRVETLADAVREVDLKF